MVLPDPSRYFDINADSKFNGTTMELLTEYLALYDKQVDKQIQRFYNERTIRYFRLSIDDDNTYIASSCHAEYKKAISYEVDILLDKTGTILKLNVNAQQEKVRLPTVNIYVLLCMVPLCLQNIKQSELKKPAHKKFRASTNARGF